MPLWQRRAGAGGCTAAGVAAMLGCLVIVVAESGHLTASGSSSRSSSWRRMRATSPRAGGERELEVEQFEGLRGVSLEALLGGDTHRVSRVFRSADAGLTQGMVDIWRQTPPSNWTHFTFSFPGTIQRLLGQVGPSITDRSISSFCCNSRLGQLREAKKISVGVFGGSVTAGTGCSTIAGRCSWPDLFETMLRTLGWDATVHNCAVGGTTTDQSVELVLARACGAYDLYIVAHGANDDVEFSEKDTAEESMERVAHTIQDLVHAVRETVNNSLIVVWDEMPAVHFLHTNGSRFENAMLAHSLGAASVAAPSLSFFQSLYLADYVSHPDDREYFRSNQVHTRFPAFLLIAAILADYIHASPLTMPPPDDHMVSHSCRREIILAGSLNEPAGHRDVSDPPRPTAHPIGSGLNLSVMWSHSGWDLELDPHGRPNWISHNTGDWMEFEFSSAVRDVHVVHLRSYSPEWGRFQPVMDDQRESPIHSSWAGARKVSVFARAAVADHEKRGQRFRFISQVGKNQIRSLSFCIATPAKSRPNTDPS